MIVCGTRAGGTLPDSSRYLQPTNYRLFEGVEFTDSYDWKDTAKQKGCPDDVPNGTVALGTTPTVRICACLCGHVIEHEQLKCKVAILRSVSI